MAMTKAWTFGLGALVVGLVAGCGGVDAAESVFAPGVAPSATEGASSSGSTGAATSSSSSGTLGMGGGGQGTGGGTTTGTGGMGGATTTTTSTTTTTTAAGPCDGQARGTACGGGLCDGNGACVPFLPVTCNIANPPPGAQKAYVACDGHNGGNYSIFFNGPQGYVQCTTNGSPALTEVGYCPPGTFCQVSLLNTQALLPGYCQ